MKGERAGLGVPVNDQCFWSRKEEELEKAKKVGRRKGHADESEEDADAPEPKPKDDEAEAQELVSASEGEEAEERGRERR